MDMNKNQMFEEFYTRGIPLIVMLMSVVVLILLGSHCVNSCVREMNRSPDEAFDEGQMVPDFKLNILNRQSSVQLYDLCEQKPVVLMFISYGCHYCDMQMSALDRRMQIDERFKVVAVSSDREYMIRKQKKNGKIPFSVALDPKRRMARAFKVYSYPTVIVIGKDREFLYQDIGYNPKIYDTISGLLAAEYGR